MKRMNNHTLFMEKNLSFYQNFIVIKYKIGKVKNIILNHIIKIPNLQRLHVGKYF